MPDVERGPGTIVAGRYVLQRKLGAGAFGEVWLAHDERAFQRPVAVKFLLREHLNSRELVTRFRREGEATAALTHPNVVALLEMGDEAGVPFLVSEFVEGESLKAVLVARASEKRPFEIREALSIFRQICAGVGAAHEKSIVHRDLKPENILVQQRGGDYRVKILDFGVARILDPRAPVSDATTKAGQIIGSLNYMAPEQIFGDIAGINARTDLFALGAILFEMLTLHRAFGGAGADNIVRAVLQGARPAPSKHRPDFPPEFDQVFVRVFELEGAKRHASTAELLADVEHYLLPLAGTFVPASTRPSGFPGADPSLAASASALRPAPLPADLAASLLENPGLAATANAPAPSQPSPPSPPVTAPATKSRAPLFAAVGALLVAGIVAAVLLRPHAPEALVSTPAPRPMTDASAAVGVPHDAGFSLENPSANPPLVSDDEWITVPAPAQPFVLGGRTAREGRVGFAPGSNVSFHGPAFALMSHEVTWRAYETWAHGHAERAVTVPSLIPANESARADMPVVGIPWARAHEFCVAAGGDLPTEEQWEFAARGSDGRPYPWGSSRVPDELMPHARGAVTIVRTSSRAYDRTPEGIFDLAGNAREWTLEPYRTNDGVAPAWGATLRAVRGLPVRDGYAGATPPSVIYRNSGCAAAQCSPADIAELEIVGFRCARPAP